MSDTRGISATLKAGTGYDAPWIVIHADDVTDLLETLAQVEAKSVLATVKQMGGEFADMDVIHMRSATALAREFPGSQVIPELPPPPAYEPPYRDAPAFSPGVPQYGQQSQQLPPSMGPACETCNAPAEYRQGTGKTGKPYKAFFCTVSRDHAPKWI